ncbi:MAG: hypothetical protein RIT03_1806 [Bacteroidota bacterium]|jgi:hypothetical protein
MKQVTSLFLVLLSTISIAQVTRNVGDFTKISVFDKIKVELIQSDENKVVLDGVNATEVEVVNKNGTVKLRLPLVKFLSGQQIEAKIYYSSLTSIMAAEGSKVIANSQIKSDDLTIETKEGAQVTLDLAVDNLNIKAYTGSELNLTGNSHDLDALINTGADLKAKELTVQHALVNVNTGGIASVTAKEYLSVKVVAGGSVFVYGNPSKLNQSVTAGGSIIINKE